jgi:DNA-binding CsgD family transcriptional regulator
MSDTHANGSVDGIDGPVEPLTPREQEVAHLVANGLTNDEIAQRLVLTPGTVANHVAHILAKQRLRSRVQLAVRFASKASTDEILTLLARLQEVGTPDFRGALQHATDILASVFAVEKVDAFLYDPLEEMLVTLGTSRTALGELQHELGLNRLPLSRGGRAAWVFQEHRPFRSGTVEKDQFELPGVRRDLGIRSTIAVPLDVPSGQRGVLLASSTQPDYFAESDLQLLQFVAYWVALVAQQQSLAVGRMQPMSDVPGGLS